MVGGEAPQNPRAPLVGVLALQGDVAEHAAMLESLGAEVREVRQPAHLEGLEGIILPGGESTTISLLLDSAGLREPLARAIEDGLSAFGTCAGMILMAKHIVGGRPGQQGLGVMDITVQRNAFGSQVESFECDLEIKDLEGPFHAVFIRAPLVERVGPEVEVLAQVAQADGSARAVLCRQGRLLAASFHPELAGDARLHRLFVDSMIASARPDPLASSRGSGVKL